MTPHGFEIRFHEPTGRHWLYIDAGTDPDGSALQHARPAYPHEVELWETHRYQELARGLYHPEQSLPTPTWLQKLLRLLRRQ